MHHGLLLKVNGYDKADAKEQADVIMSDTIRCGTCEQSVNNVNWDYFQNMGEYDTKFIKDNRSDMIEVGIDTAEKAAKFYIKNREKEKDYIAVKVEEELKKYTKELKKTKKHPIHSMLGYYLKELEKISEVIEFGDADEGLYTLHCTDNHYADMTDYTNGSKAFYFWIDRHF